jgi:sugar O-acyltransferase (sialic acid O-acetyltransferase NeuD family)
MSRIVIVGAGGHGRELADVARACAAAGEPIEIVGYVDDDPARRGTAPDGLPVLGGLNWLQGRDDVQAVCAIGSPATRRRVVTALAATGIRFRGLVHPQADLTRWVTRGEGVVITAGCVLTNEIVLGDHVHVNRMTTIGHDCRVGAFTHLAPGVVLSGNTTVGEDCSIGTNACAIQNITIGAGTTVGAGATVIRDLPAGVTAVGTPARIIKGGCIGGARR